VIEKITKEAKKEKDGKFDKILLGMLQKQEYESVVLGIEPSKPKEEPPKQKKIEQVVPEITN